MASLVATRTACAPLRFSAMLGTVAGNQALTLGATGGVYPAGGIVPRFKEAFASRFHDRLEGKGRLTDYMRAIPTDLVLWELPTLLGLANLASPTG